MSASAFAGVDVGGGGIRVRVEADGVGAGHHVVTALPHKRGKVDAHELTSLMVDAIRQATSGLDVSRFETIAIGMSGLPGRVEEPEDFARILAESVSVESTIIAGDAVSTHFGALGLRPGAVIAAGTGVIALGTDLHGVWNRADGWGILLGDDGGGAWIGMTGLKAALRAYDGRPSGSPFLLKRMVELFGDPLEVVGQVYEKAVPAGHLASFAPAVAEAAHAGDLVAAAIWRDAAVHLGQTAAAVAPGLDPLFSWGGRLFDAGDILLVPFMEEVTRRVPDARFAAPIGTSVDGALALARTRASGSIETREPYLYVFDS
jgi:N-acetylglucosamine kinase-like BadF-type ATPase